MLADQRKDIASQIKALQPKASNRAIAKMIGVDEGTVRNDTAEKSASQDKKHSKSNAAEPAVAEKSAPGIGGADAAWDALIDLIATRH